jgi:hypothetical protein
MIRHDMIIDHVGVTTVGRPDPKGSSHLQSMYKELSTQGIRTHVLRS